jgi:hypothetical protein
MNNELPRIHSRSCAFTKVNRGGQEFTFTVSRAFVCYAETAVDVDCVVSTEPGLNVYIGRGLDT